MSRASVAVVAFVLVASSLRAQSIGFVDVQKVVRDYKKTAEITANLDKRLIQVRNELKRDRDRLQTQIQDLEAASLTGNEDPLKRLEDERTIAVARIQLEIREKHLVVELERDLVEHMKKVFKEIQREAQSISTERGLGAVFLVNTDEVEGKSQIEVMRSMVLRQVLWHDERLDLTAEILRRLNR
jgi:Skp family chaperone for outer membrane proteins